MYIERKIVKYSGQYRAWLSLYIQTELSPDKYGEKKLPEKIIVPNMKVMDEKIRKDWGTISTDSPSYRVNVRTKTFPLDDRDKAQEWLDMGDALIHEQLKEWDDKLRKKYGTVEETTRVSLDQYEYI